MHHDIILLSASRNGLQLMVNICQDFVASKNLSFGTNADISKLKTKCIVFTKKCMQEPKCIKLDGNNLPWVDNIKHLGHVLQRDNSMRLDMTQKRGQFIGKTNSLLQELGHVSHHVVLKLFNSSVLTLYGSNLYDLFSKDCKSFILVLTWH